VIGFLGVVTTPGEPSCDGQRNPRQWFSRKAHHTMALDQTALLELLEMLKGADVEDRIRQAAARSTTH
jgi:hypothetical protein